MKTKLFLPCISNGRRQKCGYIPFMEILIYKLCYFGIYSLHMILFRQIFIALIYNATMAKPSIKLIFFDMDGVLFDVGYFEDRKGLAASSWALVADAIGATEEENRLKELWSRGELKSYVEWVGMSIGIYKRHGLDRKRFHKVLGSVRQMPGAKEAVAELKKRGYKTAIITGGFKELAERAKLELGIDFIIAACELIFDEKGKLADYNAFPCDYHGKVKFFEALVAGLDIKPGECAMIGDGVNDIPIAKECGFSIAFNAREELKKHCNVSIEKKDLREILRYF